MIRLSVNVNKVATIRNSRGGSTPSVVDAVHACLDAGASGITVHPRADRRHITPEDVYDIARTLEGRRPAVEYNIEGDPRDDLLALVQEVRPDQCTLVPVTPGEITSHRGWRPGAGAERIAKVVSGLKASRIRVSMFVEPDEESVAFAASSGADRVELYTEAFARAIERGRDEGEQSFRKYARAAEQAHRLGLGVNAGHDLDLENLTVFRRLPHLDEVSIGHAIISRAVFVGLERVVGEYVTLLASAGYGARGAALILNIDENR